MSILVTAEKIYKSNIDLTVCDMKIFPVEFTASNRSWFRLFPWSSLLLGGRRRKQTNENIRGVTTCNMNYGIEKW
jgi:hypothetical protein